MKEVLMLQAPLATQALTLKKTSRKELLTKAEDKGLNMILKVMLPHKEKDTRDLLIDKGSGSSFVPKPLKKKTGRYGSLREQWNRYGLGSS